MAEYARPNLVARVCLSLVENAMADDLRCAKPGRNPPSLRSQLASMQALALRTASPVFAARGMKTTNNKFDITA